MKKIPARTTHKTAAAAYTRTVHKRRSFRWITKKSCNSNIQCTVNSCAYHNPQNYCSLSQIKVGCTDASPCNCRETECASFELK